MTLVPSTVSSNEAKRSEAARLSFTTRRWIWPVSRETGAKTAGRIPCIGGLRRGRSDRWHAVDGEGFAAPGAERLEAGPTDAKEPEVAKVFVEQFGDGKNGAHMAAEWLQRAGSGTENRCASTRA